MGVKKWVLGWKKRGDKKCEKKKSDKKCEKKGLTNG